MYERVGRMCFRATLKLMIVLSALCWSHPAIAADKDGSAGQDTSDPSREVWKPGAAENALPGFIPYPAELPGVGRWQVMRQVPLCDIFCLAYSPDDKQFVHTDGQYVRICDTSVEYRWNSGTRA